MAEQSVQLLVVDSDEVTDDALIFVQADDFNEADMLERSCVEGGYIAETIDVDPELWSLLQRAGVSIERPYIG